MQPVHHVLGVVERIAEQSARARYEQAKVEAEGYPLRLYLNHVNDPSKPNEPKISAGMSCRVNIKLKSGQGDPEPIIVPTAAVFEGSTDNTPSVWVLEKNGDLYTVKKQHVKLDGFAGKDYIKIASGLQSGQQIVAVIIIAMGMLVDNAIVVTDNALMKIARDMRRRKALEEGATKPQWGLLAATVIATLSFLPLYMAPNNTAEIIKPLFVVLGILGLVGMVIKNSIVLLDQANLEMEENGKTQFEAIVIATRSRAIPVAMAAGTTILGMAPLLPDPMFGGMAVAIMGGLFAATLLTIIVLPAFYAAFFGLKKPEENQTATAESKS